MSTDGFKAWSLPVLKYDEQIASGSAFEESMEGRRSARYFKDKDVPRELIEIAIRICCLISELCTATKVDG